MNGPKATPEETLLFYDGDCGFCNAAVQFVLKHEKSKEIRFSALQSRYACALFERNKVENDLSSLIVFHKARFYKKSEAVLVLAPFLRPPYRVLIESTRLFPPFFRDRVYDLIAKNRKKLAKNPSCTLPDLADRDRFMEEVFPADGTERRSRWSLVAFVLSSVNGHKN